VIWARLAREAPRRSGEDVDGLVVIGVSRECPGRYLVKQGLEEVVVGPVNNHDFHWGWAKCLGSE